MNRSLLRSLILTQWVCLVGLLFIPTVVRWLPFWQGKILYAGYAILVVISGWRLRSAWEQAE